MNRKLVIVGDGPMAAPLQARYAGNPLIHFAGRGERDTLRNWYARARALIFPGIEDFGIVPVEAQATGCPVIALGAGGALETVTNGATGVFFPEPATASLTAALEIFESRPWSPEACQANARRFTPEIFRENFTRACQ